MSIISKSVPLPTPWEPSDANGEGCDAASCKHETRINERGNRETRLMPGANTPSQKNDKYPPLLYVMALGVEDFFAERKWDGEDGDAIAIYALQSIKHVKKTTIKELA